MTLDTLIILAGTFVAALPFLGFPARWDTVLLVIGGILIISLGIALRRRGVRRKADTLDRFVAEGGEQRAEHESL